MITILTILTAVVTIYYCGWVIFNLIGWVSGEIGTPIIKVTKQYKLTVIVACRNEQEYLANCINCLIAQDYPKDSYEVLIVDDNSTDNTAAIAKSYSEVKYIKNQGEGKKQAILTAINEATGDIIVTTDADCTFGDKLLKHINTKFNDDETQLVCGPVAYNQKKGFLNKFQAIDFASMVAMAGGGIMGGFPNTSNAANFSYRKTAFYEVGGYNDSNELPTGDDDFLMHKIHHKFKRGVKFLKNEEAIVYTDPQPSWASFFNQRTRWASKSTSYSYNLLTVTLVTTFLCYVMLVANIILAFFNPQFIKIAVWQFASKLMVEAFFMAITLPFFKKQKLLWILPQVQILHTLYIIIVVIRGNFGKYNWKGRTIKHG